MKYRVWQESDLKAAEGRMGKVGGEGVGRKPTVSPARRTSESLERSCSPPTINRYAPYRSKLESQYAAHLDLLQKAGEIRRWAYEPMSLKLSHGKRYRFDFLVILPLGAEARPEAHEVKGRWTKNRRDAMTHLKWAAQLYGDVFTFRLIEWTGHGFDGYYVTA